MHLRSRYYQELTLTGERDERQKMLDYCLSHGFEVISIKRQKNNPDRYTLKATSWLQDVVVIRGQQPKGDQV